MPQEAFIYKKVILLQGDSRLKVWCNRSSCEHHYSLNKYIQPGKSLYFFMDLAHSLQKGFNVSRFVIAVVKQLLVIRISNMPAPVFGLQQKDACGANHKVIYVAGEIAMLYVMKNMEILGKVIQKVCNQCFSRISRLPIQCILRSAVKEAFKAWNKH